MTKHNNGGPAFPCEVGPASDGHTIQTGNMQWMQPGMHLRDYFAAKAMHASLSLDPANAASSGEHARWAYEMADAMLRVRQSK